MSESDELTKAVLAAVRENGGKRVLACAEALAIAARLKVPPRQVGRICNRHKIKIGDCQLGCFK